MIFKKKNLEKVNFQNEKEKLKFQETNSIKRFQFEADDLYPILDEKTSQTNFDRHYISVNRLSL